MEVHGNCFLVYTENTNILIDVGVSQKKISDALASLNKTFNEIDAILITHEHIDHTKAVPTIASKYNIPIYANKKTWTEIISSKIPESSIKYFINEEEFSINDLTILPFSTPHDAVDPCGFKILKDGKTMCIATDLGHISNHIYNHFIDSSCLLLESNYDPDVLKISRYPYTLKQRIKGNFGHLSNESAGEVISKLAKCNLKNALLIHLSKENNIPELALTTIQDGLLKNNIDKNSINIEVAPRNNPSTIFKIT